MAEDRKMIASQAVAERVLQYDAAHPDGSDAYAFLLDIMTDDVVNHRSTVGEHVRATNIDETIVPKSNGTVSVSVHVDLVDDANEVLVPGLRMMFIIPAQAVRDLVAIPQALAELMALAFSGYMVNPIEREKVIALQMKAFNHTAKKPKMTYVCDECGKSYRSAKYFLAHLRAKGHKDGITQQYGYWGGKYASELEGLK